VTRPGACSSRMAIADARPDVESIGWFPAFIGSRRLRLSAPRCRVEVLGVDPRLIIAAKARPNTSWVTPAPSAGRAVLPGGLRSIRSDIGGSNGDDKPPGRLGVRGFARCRVRSRCFTRGKGAEPGTGWTVSISTYRRRWHGRQLRGLIRLCT
jgi:hypothetical protein